MRGSIGITTVLGLVGAGVILTAFGPWSPPAAHLPLPVRPPAATVQVSPAGLSLLQPTPAPAVPALPPTPSDDATGPSGPDVTAMLAAELRGAVEDLETPSAPSEEASLAEELQALIDCFRFSD